LAYLVLSQDEAKAWVWLRGEAGFAAGAEVIAADDGLMRIPALTVELPLGAIYKGFRAPQQRRSKSQRPRTSGAYIRRSPVSWPLHGKNAPRIVKDSRGM
jgi:hypothetical protein